ncbi:MAG: chlorophyllide a reductase subunit Z [Anaerolineae bacterium]|nr:chlorophyllide a reductase subunit Z [Candidatus Roseilinea sp.]MDW8448759.1 chlorophyllide a reductase subunit Z [Anaerolineae bacterium]
MTDLNDLPNPVPAGGKKHAPIELIRDLESTSGYWAAVWTMCTMPDVHLICDAPIGCFNLVATAVPDYTDAIPHIHNITPSVMREQEVTMLGTAGAVRKAVEALRRLHPDKTIIVVSTAESEMISSDHRDWLSKMDPPVPFFWSQSLEGDEWEGRDRALVWLWRNFGIENARLKIEKPQDGLSQFSILNSQFVNVIGPTYGCFNSPSDLHEVKRLIEGAGGKVNLVYPIEATLKDTPRLAESAVNVVMYREFGEALAKELGKPYLFAPIGIRETTEFIQKLGDLLGTREQAEAFIAHEKKTTLAPLWDLWRGPQGDWFATTEFAVVAGRTYTEGLVRLLADELGMKLQFASGRPRQPGEMNNIQIREALHKKQPAFMFGSLNEKIYLTEAQAKATHFIPAAFPGAVVRRSLGTPFMGYSGVVYIVQEMVNRYYDLVFNFLPFDNVAAAGQLREVTNPLTAASRLVWSEAARAQLDRQLEGIPWISRISASRELRAQVEVYAVKHNLREVTPEVVERALAG